MSALAVVVGAALVNNIVLAQYLGLCPLFGASRRLDATAGMALATAFVLTLSAGVCHVVDAHLLAPLDLGYLRIVAFIVCIAGLVQCTELVIARTQPLLHGVLGIYLPLITTNCAVLAIALPGAGAGATLAGAMLRGLGAAVGFALVLLLLSGLRDRIALAAVPRVLAGTPIALFTAGILAMAFMGFAGFDR
jgi:electron transport complex protein RnfA